MKPKPICKTTFEDHIEALRRLQSAANHLINEPHADKILWKSRKQVVNEMKQQQAREFAADRRARKAYDLRKEKEVRAAIQTLLKYTGINIESLLSFSQPVTS